MDYDPYKLKGGVSLNFLHVCLIFNAIFCFLYKLELPVKLILYFLIDVKARVELAGKISILFNVTAQRLPNILKECLMHILQQ